MVLAHVRLSTNQMSTQAGTILNFRPIGIFKIVWNKKISFSVFRSIFSVTNTIYNGIINNFSKVSIFFKYAILPLWNPIYYAFGSFVEQDDLVHLCGTHSVSGLYLEKNVVGEGWYQLVLKMFQNFMKTIIFKVFLMKSNTQKKI